MCGCSGIPLPSGNGAPADQSTVREDCSGAAPSSAPADADAATAARSTVLEAAGQACYARGFMLRQRQANAGQHGPGQGGDPPQISQTWTSRVAGPVVRFGEAWTRDSPPGEASRVPGQPGGNEGVSSRELGVGRLRDLRFLRPRGGQLPASPSPGAAAAASPSQDAAAAASEGASARTDLDIAEAGLPGSVSRMPAEYVSTGDCHRSLWL